MFTLSEVLSERSEPKDKVEGCSFKPMRELFTTELEVSQGWMDHRIIAFWALRLGVCMKLRKFRTRGNIERPSNPRRIAPIVRKGDRNGVVEGV
jgi:hypothetical protein